MGCGCAERREMIVNAWNRLKGKVLMTNGPKPGELDPNSAAAHMRTQNYRNLVAAQATMEKYVIHPKRR